MQCKAEAPLSHQALRAGRDGPSTPGRDSWRKSFELIALDNNHQLALSQTWARPLPTRDCLNVRLLAYKVRREVMYHLARRGQAC